MRFSVICLLTMVGMVVASCDGDTGTVSYPTLEQYLERHQITDYMETDSGLIYVKNREGTGDLPRDGQTVSVHYTGYHLDDTKFDSSYDRNEAYTVLLGASEDIRGFVEGLRLFRKGGSGTLYIPYELGYGNNSSPSGAIGPKEDLKFDINIIAID